jgi:hypothetical protein
MYQLGEGFTHLAKKLDFSWMLVAHACNPSYLEDWENHGSRPAWANSPRDPISKITRAKRTRAGGVAQVVELLLCKCEALSSNPRILYY